MGLPMAPSTLIFEFDCRKSRTFPLNALFTKLIITKVIRNEKRIINCLFLQILTRPKVLSIVNLLIVLFDLLIYEIFYIYFYQEKIHDLAE